MIESVQNRTLGSGGAGQAGVSKLMEGISHPRQLGDLLLDPGDRRSRIRLDRGALWGR